MDEDSKVININEVIESSEPLTAPENAPIMDFKQILMSVGYNDVSNVFLLRFAEGNTVVFDFSLTPDQFSQFTMDVLRIDKNYKLKKAEEYHNCKDENEVKLEDREMGDPGLEEPSV